MYETLWSRQIRIHGEGHEDTINTMLGVALVLRELDRFEDAHHTASRGVLLARKVGNEKETVQFVKLLSRIEEVLGSGGKGEQKKKSSEPGGGTEGGAQLKVGEVKSRLMRSACQQSRPKLAVVASTYFM
jgi:hypothetical protein